MFFASEDAEVYHYNRTVAVNATRVRKRIDQDGQEPASRASQNALMRGYSSHASSSVCSER